jgi:hypothetical protein
MRVAFSGAAHDPIGTKLMTKKELYNKEVLVCFIEALCSELEYRSQSEGFAIPEIVLKANQYLKEGEWTNSPLRP